MPRFLKRTIAGIQQVWEWGPDYLLHKKKASGAFKRYDFTAHHYHLRCQVSLALRHVGFNLNNLELNLNSQRKLEKNNLDVFDTVPLESLFLLARYSALYLSFCDAWQVRRVLLHRLLSQFITQKTPFLDAWKAALELRNFDLIFEKIKEQKNLNLPIKRDVEEIVNIAYLMKKGNSECYPSSCDFPFLINSNPIIIGPAHSEAVAVGDPKADQFEVVVQPNVYPENYQFQSFSKNIGYYSKGRLTPDMSALKPLLPMLDIACFKSDWPVDALKNDPESLGKAKLRKFTRAGVVMLNQNSANMVQNIVYDLFKMGVAKATLTATNFYLAAQPYAPNYHASIRAQSWVPYGLRLHEPFSNFNFIKSFYDAELLGTDKQTKDALSLGPSEYADQLDKLYPNSSLDRWNYGKNVS